MGGQACVVLVQPENIARLRVALAELQAEPIAVPPFAEDYLLRGHALHFRCRREDAAGLRIDLMSNLRGVGSFEDVVCAKKTQRDEDWR
jgi:hypothetical protein